METQTSTRKGRKGAAQMGTSANGDGGQAWEARMGTEDRTGEGLRKARKAWNGFMRGW